jgi:putative FmdB family regulatory protein
MPTYQYACTAPECGNQFELVQSFTDPAASTCPVCGGPVRKVFSAVGVVFKGSGFYRNDSRAAAGNGKSTSAAKPAAESTSSGDSATKTSGSASDTSASSSSSGSSSSSSASASPAAKSA